jgi:hypothetical protein
MSDVAEAFLRYYEDNPTWGSLHIVLDDGNISPADIRFCRDFAVEHRDAEGARLASILLGMGSAERRRLFRRLVTQ